MWRWYSNGISKKSSTKISEIQLASGNQNGNNATDDKRRKVAPIIIKTKKDSWVKAF